MNDASFQAIVDILQVPLGTVRSRISRGIAQLVSCSAVVFRKNNRTHVRDSVCEALRNAVGFRNIVYFQPSHRESPVLRRYHEFHASGSVEKDRQENQHANHDTDNLDDALGFHGNSCVRPNSLCPNA